MMRVLILIAASLLPAIAARAEPPLAGPRAGDTHEIRMERETASESSDGSSGSSTDRDMIVETVIAVRDDGVELEYDLPPVATADDRARVWEFPARVFRPNQGPLQLLNHAELEARLERWLEKAKWTRDICGRWIFTWNAFRIECDPQSVLETVEAFDPGYDDLRDGAPYRDKKALEAAPLARKGSGPNGATFIAEMKVDPDAVRRERAESDVVVAEISGKTLTLDEALRARAREAVSGTISVTFETDATGKAWRRTKVARLEAKAADGVVETMTSTQSVERRRVSPRGPAPDED